MTTRHLKLVTTRKCRPSLNGLEGRQGHKPAAPGGTDVCSLGARYPDEPRRTGDQTKDHSGTDQNVATKHPATVPIIATLARVNEVYRNAPSPLYLRTTKQIAAMSGHKSLREIERYTAQADQQRLARQAVRKLSQKNKV